MKKILMSVFLTLAIVFSSFGLFSEKVDAYVSVKGHYKKNGTYVAPYVRSNPNGLKSDNYSYKPSQGIYNSTYGTRGTDWDTPTYITDPAYYQGKALYESKKTVVTVPSYSYNTPTYDYTSLSNSTYEKVITNVSSYTASVPNVATYPSAKSFKSDQFLPYIVKYWADGHPTVECKDSKFLISRDVLYCNDYRTNLNDYNWVTTNFVESSNYTLYKGQFYSCPDEYVIASTTPGNFTCNPIKK
ncbi:MAG: hypothetical protein RL094_806 [Candidatus Parcubacteria bacterium]|jgi:hypothetical protein